MARTYKRDSSGRFAGGSGGGTKGGGSGGTLATRAKSAVKRAGSSAKALGSKAKTAIANNPELAVAGLQTAVGLGAYGVMSYQSNMVSAAGASRRTAAYNSVSNARGLRSGPSTLSRAKRTGVRRQRQRITTM